jgi:hypothetical protein
MQPMKWTCCPWAMTIRSSGLVVTKRIIKDMYSIHVVSLGHARSILGGLGVRGKYYNNPHAGRDKNEATHAHPMLAEPIRASIAGMISSEEGSRKINLLSDRSTGPMIRAWMGRERTRAPVAWPPGWWPAWCWWWCHSVHDVRPSKCPQTSARIDDEPCPTRRYF